jgi:hypothetical protein
MENDQCLYHLDCGDLCQALIHLTPAGNLSIRLRKYSFERSGLSINILRKRKMEKDQSAEFKTVFDHLSALLSGYAAGGLQVRAGNQNQVELVGPATTQSMGREVWFGAVRMGKRYVSYHLMPIYACPDLLDSISPGLKKRMQGKSCFNFTRRDDELFRELDELTRRGFDRFIKQGLIAGARS